MLGNVSYIFDAFGFLVLGEALDVIFAPISAYLEYKMYHNLAFATFNLAEEIAPYTDIIPTATINWFYEYYIKR